MAPCPDSEVTALTARSWSSSWSVGRLATEITLRKFKL